MHKICGFSFKKKPKQVIARDSKRKLKRLHIYANLHKMALFEVLNAKKRAMLHKTALPAI